MKPVKIVPLKVSEEVSEVPVKPMPEKDSEVGKDPIPEQGEPKEKPANANYGEEIKELRAKINELIQTVNLLIPKEKRPRR